MFERQSYARLSQFSHPNLAGDSCLHCPSQISSFAFTCSIAPGSFILNLCYDRFSLLVRMEQRWFGGRKDLDYSTPRVQWLHTPLHRKSEAQGTRLSKPEKKGMHPIGNSRGIAARVGRLLSGLGKALDTFLCPLHESGLVEGKRM